MLPLARAFHHALVDEADRHRFRRALLQLAAHLLVFLFHLERHRRARILERFDEVLIAHFGHLAAHPVQRVETRTANHVFEVRAGEALGLARHIGEVDIVCQRHVAGVDLEDMFAPALIGRADIDQLVEPARPQQRRIDQSRAVGGTDHDDRLQFLQPVHFGKDRVDHTARHLRFARTRSARGHQAVDLVDENDAGRHGAGTLEHPSDLLFAFAIPFGEQIRALHRNEVRLRLLGDCLGEQGLARARRPIEQEALGRANAEAMEGFGIAHRQFDAFLQLLHRIAHAADIAPFDIGNLHHDFAHGRRLDALQRADEILAADIEIVEHFGRNRPLVEIEARHDPAHSIDGRLTRQRGDVRADEAVRGTRQLLQIHLVAQRHTAGVDAEDFAPPVLVRHADHDLAIEAARTA